MSGDSQGGSGARKHGRCRDSNSYKRYLASNRAEFNKARRAEQLAKKQAKKQAKLAIRQLRKTKTGGA